MGWSRKDLDFRLKDHRRVLFDFWAGSKSFDFRGRISFWFQRKNKSWRGQHVKEWALLLLQSVGKFGKYSGWIWKSYWQEVKIYWVHRNFFGCVALEDPLASAFRKRPQEIMEDFKGKRNPEEGRKSVFNVRPRQCLYLLVFQFCFAENSECCTMPTHRAASCLLR